MRTRRRTWAVEVSCKDRLPCMYRIEAIEAWTAIQRALRLYNVVDIVDLRVRATVLGQTHG